MTKTRNLLVSGLAGVLLLAAACAGTPSASTTPGAKLASVVFLGDSIAAGESLPMSAAFKASGVTFRSIAADGGGNVLGPFADANWKTLPQQIASAKPTVLIYQITTYDWGTEQQQRAAYERLLTTVTGAGAKLVFVTFPPIRPDDFYLPHMPELNHTADAARAVAASSSGKATVLNANAVWGNSYQRDRDGKPDRSSDGIHDCQQGAARFTNWLLGQLAKLYPGFTPAAPQSWANTGWADNPQRFQGC